jgi:hypothetical protein
MRETGKATFAGNGATRNSKKTSANAGTLAEFDG